MRHIRSAALASPVAERHGHSGTNPAKDHNAEGGLEQLTQEERLRCLGLFIFNLEKARGRIVCVRGYKQMEPESSQWCLMTGQAEECHFMTLPLFLKRK